MSDDMPVRDLLEQPVEQAARGVALRLLRKVEVERRRLDDPQAADALHDFRVAVSGHRPLDLRCGRGRQALHARHA